MLTLIRRGVLAAAFAVAATAAAAQGVDPNKLFPESEVLVRDRLSVEVVGKGPDVVLIPGLSSSRATWKATAEQLKDRYRLHLVQIAGFAGEPARANAQGEVFAPTADAVAAYMTEARIAPAAVIGHSLGGSMTLYLADKHPAVVKKALIVDSLPFLAQGFFGPQATVESVRPVAATMRDSMAAGGPGYEQGLRASIARMAKSEADRETIVRWGLASDPSVVGRAMYELMLLDQRPALSRITTPGLVLYPDNVAAGAPAGMMAQVYPAAFRPAAGLKTELTADSLHFIMYDQPKAFAAAVEAFLRD